MATLTERLRLYAGALVVAEPTGGTWLPLSVAVGDADCRIGFVANRDAARLRKAIAGANKTEVIDAVILARCEEVLGVVEAAKVGLGQITLRRALHRRHCATVAAHRAECRLWALGAWAFPDLWRACGRHGVAQEVLRQWPSLASLSRAHLDSITGLVAARSRDAHPDRGAERIRTAAGGWRRFWAGHLDLDALAWEVCELLDDIGVADEAVFKASLHATMAWETYWPDDVLLSITGVGPICAAATRAWWGAGTQFASAKAAAAFVGLNPSNWESGLSASRHRPTTLGLALHGPRRLSPTWELSRWSTRSEARTNDLDCDERRHTIGAMRASPATRLETSDPPGPSPSARSPLSSPRAPIHRDQSLP